jgi:hypothetical protein
MIRVLRELLSIYDTSVRDEKSAWLLGYFTFFWDFFLDFIESKPFSYRHFRLFQQALLSRSGLGESRIPRLSATGASIDFFPLHFEVGNVG